ncbi:MAG TPA: hypothetical protein VFE78_26880, partial [Gemmataceae bacterium]|nr:hypothetical protein [Gemmataceae bacterium]
PAAGRAAQRPEAPRRPDGRLPSLSGRVVAAAADGKSMTLEVRPRGQATRKVAVKLPADVEATYDQVGPGGARPTAGYTARVWLKEDSKDTAERVSFSGLDRPRRPALMAGRVTAVAEDGRSFTMQELNRTGAQSGPVEIKLTPQTQITFNGVGPDGARPTVGDDAQVSLVSGSKDTAASVRFRDTDAPFAGRALRPDYRGKVVALAAGGKGLTLELLRARPGDAEGKRVEVQFTPRTKALFDNVPPGGAKATVGYTAQVWLAAGAKDTAVTVRYIAAQPSRAVSLNGKVTAVAADCKSFTLETARTRGAAPRSVQVKLTEKTRVSYLGVGPGGAKPTVGYWVALQLEEGSPDTSAQVRFAGDGPVIGFGVGAGGAGGLGGGGLGGPPPD